MQITNQTTLAELALHPNPIISRHALGILKEARRNIDNPILYSEICKRCNVDHKYIDEYIPEIRKDIKKCIETTK